MKLRRFEVRLKTNWEPA